MDKTATTHQSTTVLFETVHGSRCYGLDTPTSDLDIKGILVGPSVWYFGYTSGPEQIELSPDHVLYDLRKFFRLAVAANPTVLELLWTSSEYHRVVHPVGERLLAGRERFLSRRVGQTFGGYAMGQLKRIRSHRRWLLEPPKAPPERASFGLPERTVIPRDQLGAADALLADGRLDEAELTPNFLLLMDRERSYRASRKQWQQYQQWKRQRNPARAALEAKFGYDTKHAMHLVRLLRMGCEIMGNGDFIVKRPDREELLAVRRGVWSYEALVAKAEGLHDALKAATAACELPEEPDDEGLNTWCAELLKLSLKGE